MKTVAEAPDRMKADTFRKIRELVYETSGISLSESKESLVKARIAKRMRSLSMEDYEIYLAHVLDDRTGAEMQHLLNAISTNTTSFYREAEHFDFIRSVVKDWIEAGQKTMRIWCAASSTGEEPYTLGIELAETIGSMPVTAKILATDISTKALVAAQSGVYPEIKVQAVPKHLRARYFLKRKQGAGFVYEVCDSIKKTIMYRQFNLSNAPYPIKPDLDIILCRNVMIYFDSDLRQRLTAECERLLKPGGYLLVGHAESLNRASSSLRRIKPSIYVKV